jgi:hypothetical protein
MQLVHDTYLAYCMWRRSGKLFHESGRNGRVIPSFPARRWNPYVALLETATLPRVISFAEGRISGTRQRRSLPRASPRQRVTFDREKLSVKAHLCRGPGPRQRRGARRCGSRVTAALGVRLCRAPVVKPSAKLCRRSGFAEGPPACPRQLPSLPRVWSRPSTNFFFVFWVHFFFFFCGNLTFF